MASNFTIGQRVRVVRVGAWNGTPPDATAQNAIGGYGHVVESSERDTVAVEMHWKGLGVLQFLPDELEVLDESSGGRVE